MYERSGTDEQIVARLRRGNGLYTIREELGCSVQRVRKIAAAHGIELTPPVRRARMDDGEVTLQANTPSSSRRPQVRLTLPVGWSAVHVTYPDDDDGVITIRKATT